MEYYSAIKRKKLLTYIATWRNLDKIMLSEIMQSLKGKYNMIPQMRGP